MTELTKRPAKFQTNLFYSCIGPEGVAIVEKLPFKTAEDQNDLKKAITLLQQRFLGRRNVTYERYRFYQRSQKPGEDINEFIGSLRILSKPCGFQENGTDFTDQMIRDKLCAVLVTSQFVSACYKRMMCHWRNAKEYVAV